MSEFRIAQRYAKSILDLATELKVLDSVQRDLDMLSVLFRESRELELLMQSPIIPGSKKKAIVEKLFGPKVHEMTLNFVLILVRKGREKYLNAVIDAFQAQYRSQFSIQRGRLTTAVRADESIMEMARELVLKISGSRKAELETMTNEEIIGGFVLDVGDKQLNASVVHQLNQMERMLKEKV